MQPAALQKTEEKTSDTAAPVLLRQEESKDLEQENTSEVNTPLYLQTSAFGSDSDDNPEQDGAEETGATPDIQEVADKHEPESADSIETTNSSMSLQRQPETEETEEEQEPDIGTDIQAKLTIGAPNDQYEQEADQVADTVMQSPVDRIAQPFDKDEEEQEAPNKVVQAKTHTPVYLQRRFTDYKQEQNQSATSSSDQADIIQSKPASGKNQNSSGLLGSVVNNPSGGSSLPAYVRGRVEPVLGADLGHVKVHTDYKANQAAQSIHAKAFTHKNNIYLGKDQSPNDVRLLAHESTHTVQQGATKVSRRKQFTEKIQTTTSPLVQRGLKERFKRGVGKVWGATGGRVVKLGKRGVKAAYRWGKGKFEAIIEYYAPGLLKLLKGGIKGVIKNKILDGINARTGGLLALITKKGGKDATKGGVANILIELGQSAANLTKGSCEAVLNFAGSLLKFAKFLASPAIKFLKSVFGAIGKFFNVLWNDIAKPAFKTVKKVAFAAWTWIESKAKWIWDKLEYVRKAIRWVWNLLKKTFNLAWGASGDILAWIKKKAKAVWDWAYGFIKPIIEPLKVVAAVIGGVIFGPIILLVKGVPLLWKGLKWIWKNWGKKVLVKMRYVLHKKILPALKSTLKWLRDKINSAIAFLSVKIASVLEVFDSLLKALSKSTIFSIFYSAANFVAKYVRAAAKWLRDDVIPFIKSGGDVVGKALEYLRPIFVIVAALVLFPVMPWMLPVVIAGWAWRILPECFKGPIINFVIGVMIFAFKQLPDFANFGDAWPNAKAKIIKTLEEVRGMELSRKVKISNRIAKMMTGEDISWVSNVIRGVGNLIETARNMPDYFWGQAQEEVMGMNLSKPLPIERIKPRSEGREGTPGENKPITTEEINLLTKDKLSSGDIVMDSVLQLDEVPEFLKGEEYVEGYEKEFGESNDKSRTWDALRGETVGEITQTDESGGTSNTVAEVTDTVPVLKTPEEELQELMQQKPEGGCTKKKEKEPAKNTEVPEHMKKGPFSQGQRGRYLWHQMKQGVKQWFKCNWKWLLAATIVALIAFIAVSILTGGATLEALPLIMQIVGAIMIGVAIYKVMKYVGIYISEGWVGNVAEGAKALARGLAIGAIELIFALLFNLGAVIKALKGGIKGAAKAAAKAAKETVKTTLKNVRKLGRVGAKAVRRTIKNGKLVMKGIKKGAIKGAKSLRGLGKRLSKRLRFKKFKIRIKNRRFQILGYINPWVLFADGTVEYKSFKGKGRKVVGEKVTVGGRKGIVVGIKGIDDTKASKAVKDLLDKVNDPVKILENKALYNKIKNMQPDDIKKLITNRETTYELRKAISGPKPPHFQAHHLVPRELKGNKAIKKFLDDIGFGFENGARNGIMLPAKKGHGVAGWAKATIHRGSHPGYTKNVERYLSALANDYRLAIKPNMSAAQIAKLNAKYNARLDTYLKGLKSRLKGGKLEL